MIPIDVSLRSFRSASLLRHSGLLVLLAMLLMGICPPPHAMAQSAAPCVGHDKPAILYTGKTYGYLRNNDHETDSAADAFGRTYVNVHKSCPQAILVGMGDNFAPEYGSRYEDFDPQHHNKELHPVPRLGPSGPSKSPAVGFFRDQHYDALVPGQMDFYFGADFLWYTDPELPMLGANLTIKNTKPDMTPSPLCGQPQLLLPTQVSLPLQSGSGSSGGGKGKSGGKKGQGGASSQGSSGSSSAQSSPGQSGQLCIQAKTPNQAASRDVKLVSPSADSIYPWSTDFQFSLPEHFASPDTSDDPIPGTLLHPVLCPWKPSRVAQQSNECIGLETPTMLGKPGQTTTYISKIPTASIPFGKDGVPSHPSEPVVLRSGADIQLCLANDKILTCTNTPLRVQTPFFTRAWVRINRGGVNYAIFGVLDPALQGMISPENSSWGADDNYTTQVNIPDPAPALEQLVTAFQRVQLTDLSSKDLPWTYVLLAQMQRSTAQALAASLQWHEENLPDELRRDHSYHFDVILSAAAYDDATPDLQLTVDQWRWPIPLISPQPISPTPLITPHPIVTGSKMRNPLSLLEVDRTDFTKTKYINYTDENAHVITDGDKVPPARAFNRACKSYAYIEEQLDEHSLGHLEQQPGRKTCSATTVFQCLALEQMRAQLKVDVALLQSNDFYYGCNYEGPTSDWAPSEMVGRVLWNSGYLTRVSVSGTTLKSILQNSDKIAQREQSSTNEPMVRKQDLVTLGITRSGGLYYVDGAALEESKIYAIATSNQLAFETSDYPQFAQIDLASPTVFAGWDKQTHDIAQLASVPLVPPGRRANPLPLPPATSACPLTALSGSGPTGLPRCAIVAAGLTLPPPPGAPKGAKSSGDPLKRASSTEMAVQGRNFLAITLQQASVGHTNSKPNQTDTNINSNLAGVTNPNVASPRSDSLSYSDSFRLLYEWTERWNVGLDQILTFARTRTGSLTASSQKTTTGQPIPPESINLSANTLIASPFIEFQLRRNQPHWKAVVRPVTFSTGLSRTLQFLPTKAPPNAPPNTPQVEYELNLKRQENWQPSVGIRYEHDNLNFFEAGYLDQSARNVLAALTVNGVPTSLTSGTTVSQITNVVPNPNDMAIPTYKTFRQQGAYWLGMYTQHLSRNAKVVKVTYQGLTYGNFLAYGAVNQTSTILTRYAAELSNSLQVQLWGNVSFGPSYNIFWFQDQSHKAGNSLTRRDWNLQLNYSFDWHQGLEWKDALEGKTQ
jgi:hypothetical protein